jgi:alpha-ketoglutarate-dependent taurine dioxygenase
MLNLIKSISEKLEDPNHLLKMQWKKGDIGILDNLAISHVASPGTQKPRE